MTNDGPWLARLSKVRYASLLDSPRFHRALTLAHIANSLRFAQAAAFADRSNDSPAATRQRAGSFFYLTGILAEGLMFAERLGQFFKDLPSFAGIKELLRDPATDQLRRTYLTKARNEAIFHNDDSVVAETLPTFRLDEYVFASGIGALGPELYFDLSDSVYFVYATGPATSPEDFRRLFRERLSQVVGLSQRFVLAIEALLGDELANLGVELVAIPRPTDAAQGGEVL
jgi:hypothetical protein